MVDTVLYTWSWRIKLGFVEDCALDDEIVEEQIRRWSQLGGDWMMSRSTA